MIPEKQPTERLLYFGAGRKANSHNSATAAILGLLLGRLHLGALPPFDVVRRKIQGRRVQATAYRKTLLTLSTVTVRPPPSFRANPNQAAAAS
jgi:hypothetical protein